MSAKKEKKKQSITI